MSNQFDRTSCLQSYTLNRDGKPDEGHYGKETQTAENSIIDDYDYVMYGKIFRFKDSIGSQVLDKRHYLCLQCLLQVDCFGGQAITKRHVPVVVAGSADGRGARLFWWPHHAADRTAQAAR